jgi:mono/diheme cytochrome c family protein
MNSTPPAAAGSTAGTGIAVSPDGVVGAAAAAPGSRRGLITALVSVAAAACIVLMLLVLPAAGRDPYTRSTLERTGSSEAGGRLFRLNCAGCHGLAAQGLVGPNLHGVDRRKSDRELIQQVVSGRTPPMPRFQPDPQAMADLLAFLHSLP